MALVYNYKKSGTRTVKIEVLIYWIVGWFYSF